MIRHILLFAFHHHQLILIAMISNIADSRSYHQVLISLMVMGWGRMVGKTCVQRITQLEYL